MRKVKRGAPDAKPDTFRNAWDPDLRADYLFAGSPFNDSDWFRKDDDVRW